MLTQSFGEVYDDDDIKKYHFPLLKEPSVSAVGCSLRTQRIERFNHCIYA